MWHPTDEVTSRVGGTQLKQLNLRVSITLPADCHCPVAREGARRRRELHASPVEGREARLEKFEGVIILWGWGCPHGVELFRKVWGHRFDLFCGGCRLYDLKISTLPPRLFENHLVPEYVVSMYVRVHKRADRGHGGDGFKSLHESSCEAKVEERVNHHRLVPITHDEAGVGVPPLTVRLQVAVAILAQLVRPKLKWHGPRLHSLTWAALRDRTIVSATPRQQARSALWRGGVHLQEVINSWHAHGSEVLHHGTQA